MTLRTKVCCRWAKRLVRLGRRLHRPMSLPRFRQERIRRGQRKIVRRGVRSVWMMYVLNQLEAYSSYSPSFCSMDAMISLQSSLNVPIGCTRPAWRYALSAYLLRSLMRYVSSNGSGQLTLALYVAKKSKAPQNARLSLIQQPQ